MDQQESAAEELIRKVDNAVKEFGLLKQSIKNYPYQVLVGDSLEEKRQALARLDAVQAQYKVQLDELNAEIEKTEAAGLEFERMVHDKFVSDRERLAKASANSSRAELMEARRTLADLRQRLQEKSREVVNRGKVPGATAVNADDALLLALYESLGVSLEKSVSVENRWKAIQQLTN
ncbi:hypothetical protein B9G98_00187 [Wickerhamiella sorbophila]|uniref:Uncharacterized protein n=1 Tax=Wickerhamiella sorbophila TaxID=45607 RepID=A0A2T0FC73_9ASCO|nr:hypothetical protein B9G98_00187 [Wickerhamiella sorbophila]PRT52567.1 hypothetical protein B9G98_00187 [Wickerhamiella sorbophila]